MPDIPYIVKIIKKYVIIGLQTWSAIDGKKVKRLDSLRNVLGYRHADVTLAY